MLISREELQREWLVLKDYGLTDEEVVGMMEFFDYNIVVSSSKMRRLTNKTKRFLGEKDV